MKKNTIYKTLENQVGPANGLRILSLQLTFLLLVLLVGHMPFAVPGAVAATQWQDISSQVSVVKSNPIRSRRSRDAKVLINITNIGSTVLTAPARLVIKGLTPSTVSILGAGANAAGEPTIDLSSYIGTGIAPGGSLPQITLAVLGGGSVNFYFSTAVEQQVTIQATPLAVHITSPSSLITVGSTPQAVDGTINYPDAVLTVNGVTVAHNGSTFHADVALTEGHNTIVARAVRSTEDVTDSLSVSFDKTPPYLTIDSHKDGQTVNTATVTVTGLINDIVRGTIEQSQANVIVNGVAAKIANRSYAADITLKEGKNIVTVQGSDQVGNTSSVSISLNYVIPVGKRVELVSGQSQSAVIAEVLPNPLVVKVIDDALNPVLGATVVFRVIQGSGVVAPGTTDEGRAVVVTTDSLGQASTNFKLGVRVGEANHKVSAKVVGYDSTVVFAATATGRIGNKISVNSGNNQRGVAGGILPEPMVVVVTDSGANVVSNARVRFDVTKGGGTFPDGSTSYQTLTDSDGRATAEYVLGDLVGLDAQRVSATLIDAPIGQVITAGFSATAFVPADPGLTSISGVVLDNQDNPIPGVTIRVDGTTRLAVTDA